MKIIISIVLLTLSLFAADMNQSYEQLNLEIDKISSSLSAEEKINLYYLILSTHDKLRATISKQALHSIDNLRTQTLKALTMLQKNNKLLTGAEIKKIKDLYIAMSSNIKQTIKEQKLQNKQIKIIYKERVIHKNPYITSLLIGFILMFLFISLFLGYLLYNSKNHTTIKKFPLINELEKHNKKLAKDLLELKTYKQHQADDILEDKNRLEKENNSLQKSNHLLKEQIEMLEKDVTKAEEKNKIMSVMQKQELQNLNEFVESLQHELSKHESSKNY